MTIPKWSADPYWHDAAEAFAAARNAGVKQLCIDLDALTDVLYRDDGPAYRLMDAMVNVRGHEELDGYRGAPRVLAAILMRLSELRALSEPRPDVVDTTILQHVVGAFPNAASHPSSSSSERYARELHPARALWQQHLEIVNYPFGCLPVPTPIPYTSFFPGGFGLWNPDRTEDLPEFPTGGVMILGHDFHSEDGYKQSVKLGMESLSQPTWRSLTQMLGAAGISLHSCFFTNFYMGLRRGTATTGRYPGSSSPEFVTTCRDFLRVQLEVQRPRLVLVLGAWVPSLVAPLGGGLEAWTSCTTLREIDERGLSILPRVQLHSGGTSVWTALSHPSFYPRSASGRVLRGHQGREAHEQLIREALALANLG